MKNKYFRHIVFVIKFILISCIKFYKKAISPFLPHACRFKPTCSEYMIEAIETHGIIKGLYLGVKRLLRCHPWGGFGNDPVPMLKDKAAQMSFDTGKKEETLPTIPEKTPTNTD